MSKQIRCECGFIAAAATDDDVVGMITEHVRTDHPDVLAGVDRQDLYGWIEDI